MADWTLPQLSDLKVDVLNMLKLRDVDAITLAEDPIAKVTGSIRWWRAQSKFQSWNGTAWVDLVISHGGGGTGATNPGDILVGLGLGTMSTQNSNAVTITGGSISGLTALGVAGNIQIGGVIVAGSTPTVITNSAGRVLESVIEDANILARVAADETITGSWTFTGSVTFTLAPRVYDLVVRSPAPILFFQQTDGATNQIWSAFVVDGNVFELRFYDDGPTAYNPVISITRSGTIPAAFTINSVFAVNTNKEIYFNGSSGLGVIAYFSGEDNVGKGIAFRGTGNVEVGSIYHAGATTWYNSDNHVWRSANGLTEFGRMTFQKFIIPRYMDAFGYVYPNSLVPFMQPIAPSLYFAADTYWFYSYDNATPMARFENNGLIQFGGATAKVSIGGYPGTSMQLYRSGVNAFFHTHGTGGITQWYEEAGTGLLMTLSNGAVLHVVGGYSAPNGAPEVAAYRYSNSVNSGMYLNTTIGTSEFGATFNEPNRSIMRTYASAAKIDFMVANTVIAIFDPTFLRLQGHVLTTGHCYSTIGGSYVGLDANPWEGIRSRTALVIISDIREKEVHGKLENVLDLVDDLEPIIASLNSDPRHEKFPTFSAQDVQEKIDARLGTNIVHVPDDPTLPLGMAYDKLAPVMWQMIRELRAKVKALEN